MSVWIDAVRSASRAARYDRLRRAERGSAAADLGRALLLWGAPAVAPGFALLAIWSGHDRRLLTMGVALAAVLFLAHLVGKPRMHAFDLLQQPSRRGLVLGHALRRLPLLLWCGTLVAVTWLVRVPTLRAHVDGMLLLVAAVLAPLALGLSSGAARVAGRAGQDESGFPLVLLLPVVGWEAARIFDLQQPSPWLLPVAGGVLALLLIVQSKQVAATVRKGLAAVLAAAVALPVAMSPPDHLAPHVWSVPLFGTGCLVCALVVIVMSVRTQLTWVEQAEIVRTRGEGTQRSPAAPSAGAVVLRRERATTGLWRARLAYARAEWLPDAERGVASLGAWAGTGMVLLLTVLRGPLLAVTAVALAADGRVPLWLAVLAGAFASRAVAVDTTELQPRLWLLGVDYREQVLHGLRALLRFAALPTLAAAVAAAALLGPDDASRWAAVIAVAAALLLRAGLPGAWPLEETHRLRLVAIWALVLAATTLHPWWTPQDATRAAGVAAAVGLLLLVARILRLREPHLADCVRRAEEP